MAIYHFSATIIQRDKGRSAIAAAAYRSAERLYDARQDMVHDYTQKQGVVYREILLPKQAPVWLTKRETLWNLVEATEKRKDSQLAREFNISLPRELTTEQNIILAKDFVTQAFVKLGMVADLCIHNDINTKGEKQPHMHVMLSMREITPDGFGQKAREWNARNNIYIWRERWAEVANYHLALHGHDMRIDHRSFKEQDIDLEPQYKIGSPIAKDKLARTKDHERIAHTNGEKLIANPSIALDAITRQQSTFTHHDIARFINRHSTNAVQFQTIYDRIKASADLVALGIDEHGRERYTTRNMATLETTLFNQAMIKDKLVKHRVNNKTLVKAKSTRTLSQEQKTALEHIVQGTDVACVIGFAGTGKSYMLGAAREAWEKDGYRVIGATLSGIAAETLEASAGIGSRTLASLCYAWDNGRDKLCANDIVVVDEAGMLGTCQMARIFDEANKANAKVVLIGDPEQLQAIDAGAAFRGIAERVGYVELSDVRRQKETWQQMATKELATHQTAQAIQRYAEHQCVHALSSQETAREALVAQWHKDRLSSPDKSQIILAYTREDVLILNELARFEKTHNGELGIDKLFQTERGKRSFAVGDRLYFLKNDRGLGVKNGTLGTLEAITGHMLTILLDTGANQAPVRVNVDIGLYNHLEHGYAATIHKAQGITVDRTYLLASTYLDRHASYVGMSRHRDYAHIYYSTDIFTSKQALMQTMARERTKDLIVDYQHEDISDKPLVNEVFIESQTEKQTSQFSWQSTQLRQSLSSLDDHLSPVIQRLIKLQKRAMSNGLSPSIEAGLTALTQQLYQNPRLKQEIRDKVPMLYEHGKYIVSDLDIKNEH